MKIRDISNSNHKSMVVDLEEDSLDDFFSKLPTIVHAELEDFPSHWPIIIDVMHRIDDQNSVGGIMFILLQLPTMFQYMILRF